jgi:hypothetical protein
MPKPSVLLAPVAAEIIASAIARPRLLEEVAFAARRKIADLWTGMPVYIYAAPDFSPFHPLLRHGVATWAGTLVKIVPAVSTGPRRAMHPDPSMRPPFAEAYDYRDARSFWHVAGLAPLTEPIPLVRFRDENGFPIFDGLPPQCMSRATLANARADATLVAA